MPPLLGTVRIMTGTPVLEYLKLEECWGLTNIKVHSRILRELVIHGYVEYSEMDFPLKDLSASLAAVVHKGVSGCKEDEDN